MFTVSTYVSSHGYRTLYRPVNISFSGGGGGVSKKVLVSGPPRSNAKERSYRAGGGSVQCREFLHLHGSPPPPPKKKKKKKKNLMHILGKEY